MIFCWFSCTSSSVELTACASVMQIENIVPNYDQFFHGCLTSWFSHGCLLMITTQNLTFESSFEVYIARLQTCIKNVAQRIDFTSECCLTRSFIILDYWNDELVNECVHSGIRKLLWKSLSSHRNVLMWDVIILAKVVCILVQKSRCKCLF